MIGIIGLMVLPVFLYMYTMGQNLLLLDLGVKSFKYDGYIAVL